MLQLYRITRCIHANDISGAGARLYGGRWNSIGKAMIYTASSRALATLEALVHLPTAIIPDNFCLVTIEAPEDVFEADIRMFPPNWNAFPEPEILRRTGDYFLKQCEHLLMKVPSAIVKEEYNYLVNPQHPKANKIRISHTGPFTFDERLL